MKIGIIVSQWTPAVTDKLLEGAETGLTEMDAVYEVFKVPGAFEIPVMASYLAARGDFDGLITLGVVIKGETDHYDMICRACVDGIQRVSLDYKIPISFEVLMVSDVALALERASDHLPNNKGYTAAGVVADMVSLMP
jgi:6,7-dimethyl-8-ribityllumazine synthase